MPTKVTSMFWALSVKAVISPSLPSPRTITFSKGFMCNCSVISQAAASGSTNTACSSGTLSGTSKRTSVGIVKYSAKHPSFLQIPKV